MDLQARRVMVEGLLALPGDQLWLVPLEQYLAGNTDDASLSKGMRHGFDLAAYARGLRAIAARADVSHAFVQVHEIPDIDDPGDDDIWAQAFVIFFVTSARLEELAAGLRPLPYRDIQEGWGSRDQSPPHLEVRAGFRPVRLDLG